MRLTKIKARYIATPGIPVFIRIQIGGLSKPWKFAKEHMDTSELPKASLFAEALTSVVGCLPKDEQYKFVCDSTNTIEEIEAAAAEIKAIVAKLRPAVQQLADLPRPVSVWETEEAIDL